MFESIRTWWINRRVEKLKRDVCVAVGHDWDPNSKSHDPKYRFCLRCRKEVGTMITDADMKAVAGDIQKSMEEVGRSMQEVAQDMKQMQRDMRDMFKR